MDCISLAEDRGPLLDLVNMIMNFGPALKGQFLVICNCN
jgi:hypothetical protein